MTSVANERDRIVDLVAQTLVIAGSTFSDDKKRAYRRAIECEQNPRARWALETILCNAEAAERDRSPLCDDTGIPHIILEVGEHRSVPGELLEWIQDGVAEGLTRLPGRPMGIRGDDRQRLDQSGGLDPSGAGVASAPILVRRCDDDAVRLRVLMLGGGPAIRAKTYRVFHRHDTNVVIDEIVSWAIEGAAQLGCSPCTLGIGVGRSHFEATSLMLEAQTDGCYDVQSEIEEEITRRVNEAGIGPLGLKGNTSVLATFMKVGPQRASGVRIVCVRPSCCLEPRVASADLY